MTDAESRLRDELAIFSDLGTDPPRVACHDGRLIVEMTRDGDELQLAFPDGGEGKVLERRPNDTRPRSHASYRALLASETFGDLRIWADHQRTVLRDTLNGVDARIRVVGVMPGTTESLDIGALDDLLVPGVGGERSVRTVLIDGPAGIGKTRFIEFLAALRADRFLTTGRPLVLHVQSRGRVLTFLQDLIAFSLQRLRLNVTFDQLPVLVRHGLVTLAIDGFDELGDPNGYELAWSQVNEIVTQIRGKGTLVLAGRETFIGRERISKRITSLGRHDVLDALSLRPPDPDEAKRWLRTKGWSEDDIESADALLEHGSYALRPFFLAQLADPDVVSLIRESPAGHPLAFLVEMMIEREAGKFGDALDRVLSDEQRRDFVRSLLREVARHMADEQSEAIDEVLIAWLVEFAAPADLDPESLALLKNRAAVVAFLENDGAPRYRRFAHAQLLNFFLAELTIDAVSSDEIPKFIRRNILGTDFLAAFSDLVLHVAASEPERVQAFFRAASATARVYLNIDRGARNLGTLLVTSLPAMHGSPDLRIGGIATDESLIQGTAPEAVMANVAINQLDTQGADLRNVTFENCWIGTLIVDETTRVSPSCPAPDRIRCQGVGVKDDSVLKGYDEINDWLDRHGRTQSATQRDDDGLLPNDLLDDELVILLHRACRNRAYWISKYEYKYKPYKESQSARLVDHPRWSEVLGLLREHDLVREAQWLSSPGRTNTFVHIKRRTEILAADPEDTQIRDFYTSLVARIRRHERRA